MQANDSIDFSLLADILLDVVCAVDENSHFVYVSAACEKVFGYRSEEMVGRPLLDFVHPDDRARTAEVARAVMTGEPRPYFENRYLRKDGSVAHIMWSAAWSSRDRLRMGVARDITARKREEALRAALFDISEAVHRAGDLQSLFAHIHLCISGLLPARNFFVALLDDSGAQLEFPYHVDECDPVPSPQQLDGNTLSGEVIRTGRTLLVTPDNKSQLPDRLQVPVGTDALDWLGVPLVTDEGVIGALVVQSYSGQVRYSERDKDILHFVSNQVALAVARKRLQQKLEHLALHDSLTGLPNRRLFLDRLHGAILRGLRYRARFALVYLDLDDFKAINDRYGHEAGDRLLQDVGLRLQDGIRASDTVARLGGDEFVLLLENLQGGAELQPMLEKVQAAFAKEFSWAAEQFRIQPSIGVAFYPDDGEDEASLLAQADRRMYEAKRR